MARVTGVRALPIVGAVFLIIGGIGLAVAGTLAALEMNSGRTAHADGVVVEATYRALIEFRTASGETIQFRNWVNSTSNEVGQHVPVAYNPADPKAAAADAFVGRWFLPGLAAMIAGPMFLVGFGLFTAGRTLARRPPPDIAR